MVSNSPVEKRRDCHNSVIPGFFFCVCVNLPDSLHVYGWVCVEGECESSVSYTENNGLIVPESAVTVCVIQLCSEHICLIQWILCEKNHVQPLWIMVSPCEFYGDLRFGLKPARIRGPINRIFNFIDTIYGIKTLSEEIKIALGARRRHHWPWEPHSLGTDSVLKSYRPDSVCDHSWVRRSACWGISSLDWPQDWPQNQEIPHFVHIVIV